MPGVSVVVFGGGAAGVGWPGVVVAQPAATAVAVISSRSRRTRPTVEQVPGLPGPFGSTRGSCLSADGERPQYEWNLQR